MTILVKGQYFGWKLLRTQQNCHPDRISDSSVVEGPAVPSPSSYALFIPCPSRLAPNSVGADGSGPRGGWLAPIAAKFPHAVKNAGHHQAEIRPHQRGAPAGEIVAKCADHCPAVRGGQPGYQHITKRPRQTEGNQKLPPRDPQGAGRK